jgi:hypothetical protein
MTFFNEQISLLLSTVAILISLISLFIALRKQKFDEQTVLAQYIEKIKTAYGEGIEHSINILAKLDNLEKGFKKEKTKDVELIHKIQSIMTDTKSMYESLYNKLGHQDIKTFDPVLLAAITVECNAQMHNLELMIRIIKGIGSQKEGI